MTRALPLFALALGACTAELGDTGEDPWIVDDVVLTDHLGQEHALADHVEDTVLIELGAFW